MDRFADENIAEGEDGESAADKLEAMIGELEM